MGLASSALVQSPSRLGEFSLIPPASLEGRRLIPASRWSVRTDLGPISRGPTKPKRVATARLAAAAAFRSACFHFLNLGRETAKLAQVAGPKRRRRIALGLLSWRPRRDRGLGEQLRPAGRATGPTFKCRPAWNDDAAAAVDDEGPDKLSENRQTGGRHEDRGAHHHHHHHHHHNNHHQNQPVARLADLSLGFSLTSASGQRAAISDINCEVGPTATGTEASFSC